MIFKINIVKLIDSHPKLTPTGLQKRPQMASVTSKVSLKLTSRINLERRGASSTLDTAYGPQAPPPHTPTHTHTHTHNPERANEATSNCRSPKTYFKNIEEICKENLK